MIIVSTLFSLIFNKITPLTSHALTMPKAGCDTFEELQNIFDIVDQNVFTGCKKFNPTPFYRSSPLYGHPSLYLFSEPLPPSLLATFFDVTLMKYRINL